MAPSKRTLIEKTYLCELCGVVFKTLGLLGRHALIHTGKRDFLCEICGKTFLVIEHLNIHKKRHGERTCKCENCDMAFFRKAELERHMLSHSCSYVKHTCSECGKGYKSISSLRSHQRIHTLHNVCVCSKCSKVFTSVAHLERHERKHRKVKDFVCEVCGNRYTFKGALTFHSKKHQKP